MKSFPHFKRIPRDFKIDFTDGGVDKNSYYRRELNLRRDLKFKGGAEQFFWYQKFHFSLCLNNFAWHEK